MKRTNSAFSIKSRIATALIAAVLGLTFFVIIRPMSAAHPANAFVRKFATVDVALAATESPPQSGWRPVALDGGNLIPARDGLAADAGQAAWLRVRFDRATLPPGPIAVYCPRFRQRSAIYLNGHLFIRDFVRADEQVLFWNKPLLEELPAGLLRPGLNELHIRLDTPLRDGVVSATPIRIGALQTLSSRYERRMDLQIRLPRAISAVIAILSFGLLLLWAARPKESVYGWLAAVGALWFVRNQHYYVAYPPFDAELFNDLSFGALFPLQFALYGFCASFFQLPNRGRIVAALCAFTVVLAASIQLVSENSLVYFLILIASMPVAALAAGALVHAFARAPNWPRGLMLAAVVAAMALSINDLLLQMRVLPDEWFYLQPLASMLVFLAFGFAVNRRMADSLSAAERMNAELERRVDSARSALIASEAERRRLEVARAVDSERQRLMRDMHDGIGSNLATALAAARAVGESQRTIDTLRRCLTDLKITVDTLEPFEGDVATLLANLRYRIEPQLRDAGLALDWRVAAVRRLDWLDSASALHLLRIVQEALGNIVAHARAATIAITVENAVRDAAAGVRVAIADDGEGLGASHPAGGRGIANMRARADSIGAALSIHGGAERGVVVEVWLPALAEGPFTAPAADIAVRALNGGFIDALVTPGPAHELKGVADDFGWLIGGWMGEVRDFDPDGGIRLGQGEWWFAWVLEGRAIQDVWIVPPRSDRATPRAAAAANERYGSTIRRFDREGGLWRMTWTNPANGAENQLAGRRAGDRITLHGEEDGKPIRWSFNNITHNTFDWRGEVLEPAGGWRLQSEFHLKRIRS